MEPPRCPPFEPFLNVQLSGIKYTCDVVRPSPSSISELLPFPQLILFPSNTNSPALATALRLSVSRNLTTPGPGHQGGSEAGWKEGGTMLLGHCHKESSPSARPGPRELGSTLSIFDDGCYSPGSSWDPPQGCRACLGVPFH